jgi:GntR family transcriptional regulator
MLVKVQGKGTFVALNPPTSLPPIKYTGFLEEVYERVLKLEVKHVGFARVPVPEKVRQILQLEPSETEIIEIKRRRHTSGEPFSFTINYLPLAIGERINPAALYKVPLLPMLERDLKIPIVRAEETVEAAPADPTVAEQLAIPVLYPVMHISRVMFTENEKPFEVVETFYRADKYQYRVNLTRVSRNGKWGWSPDAT